MKIAMCPIPANPEGDQWSTVLPRDTRLPHGMEITPNQGYGDMEIRARYDIATDRILLSWKGPSPPTSLDNKLESICTPGEDEEDYDVQN